MSMLRQTIRLASFARKTPISLTPSRRFCSTTGGEGIACEGWTLRSAINHLVAFGIIYGLYDWVDYGGKSLHIEKEKLHAEVMKEWKLCRDLEKQMRDLRLQAEMMEGRK